MPIFRGASRNRKDSIKRKLPQKTGINKNKVDLTALKRERWKCFCRVWRHAFQRGRSPKRCHQSSKAQSGGRNSYQTSISKFPQKFPFLESTVQDAVARSPQRPPFCHASCQILPSFGDVCIQSNLRQKNISLS